MPYDPYSMEQLMIDTGRVPVVIHRGGPSRSTTPGIGGTGGTSGGGGSAGAGGAGEGGGAAHAVSPVSAPSGGGESGAQRQLTALERLSDPQIASLASTNPNTLANYNTALPLLRQSRGEPVSFQDINGNTQTYFTNSVTGKPEASWRSLDYVTMRNAGVQ